MRFVMYFLRAHDDVGSIPRKISWGMKAQEEEKIMLL